MITRRFTLFVLLFVFLSNVNAWPLTKVAAAFVIPKAPVNLVAVAISQVQVTLTWQDSSTDETGFELEASLDGKTFAKLIDLPVNTVTYAHLGLKASTAYFYRIRAKNASGVSVYSNTATATTLAPVITIPKAPTVLTAVAASGSQINLTWTDNATDETGFELERSLDGTNFVKLADLPVNTVTFQNTGLTPVTRYWYRVLAKNTAGKSAYSNIASAITLDVVPLAPDNLNATSISTAQINISWADKSANETGFQLERSPDGVTFLKIADLPVNAVSYQNVALNPATIYYYRIRAVNAIGFSAYSNINSAKTQNIPVPNQPENFTAVPTEPELVQLRWAQVTGNATEIVIERAKGSDETFTQIAKLAPNVMQYEDRGQMETSDYYYRIKANNAGGSSPYSLISIVRASSIITSTGPEQNKIFVSGKTLITELKTKSGCRLNVYDLNGAVRAKANIMPRSRTDLSNLPQGIYIVVILTENEVITRKILLN